MNLLATDGYKMSMAEAGYPLRTETFVLMFRRGGPHVVPFDVRAAVEALLPEADDDAYAYLAANDYAMGAGFRAAIRMREAVRVSAVPKGAWVLPREPIATITGPSALVSWLEPLLLQLHHRLQVATLALTDEAALARELATVTCAEERELVVATLDAVGVRPPPMAVADEAYVARVTEAARALVAITGDGARVFEVGLRAATCVGQHLLALEACKAAGITRTSHVLGAQRLGMVPVGTMGHEHVQRFGADAAAFRAMRDRRPGRSSYLLDTFDTVGSGIPAAFDAIAEDPARRDSVRFDSGDKEAQLRLAADLAARRGLRPVYILEDALDVPQTARFEVLRTELGIRPDELFYGFGGALVARTTRTRLTRDHVSAVYKLSATDGRPTMKLGDEPDGGKASLPGRPVVFRRMSGDGPLGLVGQEGEAPPPGYALLTNDPALTTSVPERDARVDHSAATAALVRTFRKPSRS